MDTTDPQLQRRRFFAIALVALFLPVLAISLLPNAQAEETIEVGADPNATSTAPTTTAAPSTTAAPTTTASPTTTAAPPTTVRKPATTTTTAAPRVVTTTTTSPPAPAPAPVAVAAPVAQGDPPTAAESAFLACVRQRESGGNYGVVSSNGLYFGAYQFARSSWDSTARHAGRTDLVGIPPNQVAPGDQDAMALVLFRWQGKAPWGGAC